MKISLPPLLVALALILLFLAPDASALDDGRMAVFYPKISPDGQSIAYSWVGDIWIADIGSGACRRVTDNVAYDSNPAWFPDSRKIAFSSNREGNNDIYAVGINGGIPERHTWYGLDDTCLDVSPDGEKILIASYREAYSYNLYEVDIHGGLPVPLTHHTGVSQDGSYSHDGKNIVVTRGPASWTRRFYNGSGDNDLYILNRESSDAEWVEDSYNGNDMWADYSPDDEQIYFVSDRDGIENIYRIPSSGGPAEQLTFFTDRPVYFMSMSDTGRIAFIQNFQLWTMEPGEEPRQVDLDVGTEPKHSQEIRLDIAGQVDEMELSPDGTKLALIVRGELYITPLHDPEDSAPVGDVRYWEAIRVTNTPSRERYVTWHPDGDRVALISDRDGNNEVYEINLRNFEWTRLTETGEEEYAPDYCPSGAFLAYFRGNKKLIVRNLDSGQEKTAVNGLLQLSPWPPKYEWSPDSKWIAYTGGDNLYEEDVWVVGIDPDGTGTEPVNITLHHDTDTFMNWSDDGKSIYFMSNRNASWGLNGWGWWSKGESLYVTDLPGEQAPRSDVLEFDESESSVVGDEPVVVNFERIDERARLVSPTSGGGWFASLSPDGGKFIYDSDALGRRALWQVPFEGGSAEYLRNIDGGDLDIEWLPDSKGFFYLNGRRIGFYLKKNDYKYYDVPIYGRLTVDLNDEREQMIREAGRVLANHFYDADMHGTDWDAQVDFYSQLVRESAVPEDFALLMKMLYGELDASHLNSYGPPSYEGIASNVGYLGLDFDATTDGQGLLVTRVYPRGPADYDESRIDEGEWVLSIDGIPVSTSMNYWSLLDDKTDRTVILAVASNQDGNNTRDVIIAPAPYRGSNSSRLSFSDFSYMDFVDHNRQIVEDATDGRVGYIHIRGMSGGPLEDFARKLFSENLDKEALIIDVRFNGGGNTHAELLDILSRPVFGYNQLRDANRLGEPNQHWNRPTNLLINEQSYSDAEIFPAGFKALDIGDVIGETTNGYVIGTWNMRLVDGSTTMRIPGVGWYTVNGRNMENMGVDPDIHVVQNLNHMQDGIDDQLNAAIENILSEL